MENLKLQPHIENILKERYYLKNETSWGQVSKRISSIYPKMYEYILHRKFIPSTPTLMNLNTNGERNGTLSSCFILGIEDSIDNIMDSMKECAVVTKAAGGVGYDFSKLRGSNENVKSISANSGGVMSFIGIFDSVLDGVRQGGKRRGAGMSMLSIYRPDILKFIDAKTGDTKKYTRSNFSVRTDSTFYKILKNNPDKTFKTKNVVDGKENELKDESGIVYTYKMLWDKIIHNAWKSAEPGIFNGDIAADRCTCKHITDQVFSNPCQEYTHIPYTSCNLGSINLSLFLDKDNKFDWELFRESICNATVYLNHIIDANKYPIERLKKETLAVRPIGLGEMGFAHLLYLLKIPYDSIESYELAEKINRFMTLTSMQKSMELAKETGKTYEYYDYATFMDANKRFFNFVFFMGIDVEKLKEDIKIYGVYNSCFTSVAPTGCIEENTRVVTSNGLIKIKDIISKHPEEKQFSYDIPEIMAASENGQNRISAFYNNGEVTGYNIEMEDGRNIKISSTHRIRILKNGEYSWVSAPDIKIGDVVVLAKNSSVEVKEELKLNHEPKSHHFNCADKYTSPTTLNEQLAEWLGIFTGDGSMKFRSENGKVDGVRFPADSKDIDFAEYIKKATMDIFNIDSTISKCKNKRMYEICAHSVNLGNFLIENGFSKKNQISSVAENHAHIYHVPELIFRSPKRVICAYLRGLFETDGCISNGQIVFSSKFEHMAKEVQELLIYVGIQSNISKKDRSQDAQAFNDVMFALNIRYKHDKILFRDKIGFISNRKKTILKDNIFEIDSEKIYVSIDKAKLYRSQIAKKFSHKHALYQDFNGYICRTKDAGMVYFNRDILNEVSQHFTIDLPFGLNNTHNVKVRRISIENIKTYDIEVDNKEHTYLTANGVINHNTISYIANCSSGIEPVFGLVFTRKIEKENKSYEKVYLVDPIFEKYVEYYHQNNKKDIYEYITDNNGSCQGCELLTRQEQSIFKVAGDITPEWHLKILAAVANNISLSVSKCVAKGTGILTNKGLINIEDLGMARGNDKFDKSIDGIKVKDINGNWKKVTKHYSGGIKPTKIIKFDNGNTIEFADTHKLLTTNGWSAVSDLNVNDYIQCRASKYETNKIGNLPITIDFANNTNSNVIFLPNRMNKDLSLFLGMIASDGHLVESIGSVGITTADDSVEKVFTELSKKIFKIETVNIQYDKRTKNTRSVYITSRKLCRYIVNLLNGHNCVNKKIPDQILNGSTIEKINFINGLTLDGYIARNRLVLYEGYSKALAASAFHICCELGLKPRIFEKFVKTGRLSNRSYGISVDYNCFNPIELHKNKVLNYSNIIPVPEKLKNIMYKDLDKKYYNSLKTLRTNKYKSIRSNNSLLELCNWDKDLYLLKIVSIKNSINEVYDIEVEDTHSYLIDNIISHNTINLPRNCSEQEINDIFVSANEMGVIGVTVYRDGSREGILVHRDSEDAENPSIKRRDAPKRPIDLECDIHEMNIVVNGKSERVVSLVGKLYGTVYEIFVTKDIKNKLDFEKHKTGIIRKIKKGRYDLIIVNGEERICIENISEIFGGTFGTLSRLVSMSLRHGTPLQIIIDQLGKNTISGFFEFDRCVARVLKHYIKEGEQVITSDKCPECKSDLIYIEGCKSCSNKECGWSRCN